MSLYSTIYSPLDINLTIKDNPITKLSVDSIRKEYEILQILVRGKRDSGSILSDINLDVLKLIFYKLMKIPLINDKVCKLNVKASLRNRAEMKFQLNKKLQENAIYVMFFNKCSEFLGGQVVLAEKGNFSFLNNIMNFDIR